MESASNAGIEESTAPLLTIHDDDDTWSPAFLQETIAALDANLDRDVAVVRTRLVHEHEVAGVLEDEWSHLLWEDVSGLRLLEMMRINRTVPIAVLYRRSVHESVGPYDESMPVTGDYEFYLRALQKNEFFFIERELAQWRHRRLGGDATVNSMYAMHEQHEHVNRELRDAHLRLWTEKNGIGLPLFIAHTARTEAQEAAEPLQERLARIEDMLEELRSEHSAPVSVDAVLATAREVLPEPVKARIRQARGAVRRLRGRGD